MSEFSLEQAINDFVDAPEFFEELKRQMTLVVNPEKKLKLMEDLMSYKLSKLKTSEPVADDRFRSIQITYIVQGQPDNTIDNGNT